MSGFCRLATVAIFAYFVLVLTESISAQEQETASNSSILSLNNESTRTRPYPPPHHLHLNSTNGSSQNETSLNVELEDEAILLNLTSTESSTSTHNFTLNLNETTNGTTNGTQEEVVEVIEIKKPFRITFEDAEFVLLRLKHISDQTTSNITQLLELQKKEFKVNKHYASGWNHSEFVFNSTKRDELYKIGGDDSIVQKVPEEYHIAIIAYTDFISRQFNKDTREVCSGTDVENYKWKSYFKLLQLAIETLGTEVERWRDNSQTLYRGVSLGFELKEDQVVTFQHFISTSTSLEVAEEYANGSSVFEFHGIYDGMAMAVSDHSMNEYEKEYLLSPLQAFRVEKVEAGDKDNRTYSRYVMVQYELQVEKGPCGLETETIGANGEFVPSIGVVECLFRAESSAVVNHGISVLLTLLITCIHILY
ncbi:unnamed protein product [Orchesella dallaii]|uniref:NAD(P)(+)--arginine ADP-ribosyltransferase n=1 Tax=Orchesella dallaii TaxID=48710 RepID=A0ABP1PMW1_9HEXA